METYMAYLKRREEVASQLENYLKKTNELLRRVYDVVEMEHLNNHKLTPYYDSAQLHFKRRLGEDIFNWLQSHDYKFRDIVIKRQKRWRQLNEKN